MTIILTKTADDCRIFQESEKNPNFVSGISIPFASLTKLPLDKLKNTKEKERMAVLFGIFQILRSEFCQTVAEFQSHLAFSLVGVFQEFQ